MQKQSLTTKSFGKIPLLFVIVVPFVLQIMGAVGLVGYLSLKNGQKAVEDLANQLMMNVGDRIQERLDTYLSIPYLINSINRDSIKLGQLNSQNFDQLKRNFFQQQNLFKSVISITFINSQGELIWTRRKSDGSFELGLLRKPDKNNLHLYSLDSQGNQVRLDKVFPNYNALQRPWYTVAKAVGKPTWSSIYPWVVEPNAGIAAATPIYEAPGKLRGVLSTDLILSDISKFLNSLKISPSGQTFIIERSGEIVATSTLENLVLVRSSKQKIARLQATESNVKMTRSTAKELIERFDNLKHIKATQQLNFIKEGKRQFVQVKPYRDKFGLDWLIVVVVPETDFMAQINANTHTTIWLCLGALGVAVVFGVATARWITLPLLRLIEASRAIANGELDQNVAVTSINELAVLAQSFNQMSQQLASYSRSMEEQVNRRTHQLQLEIRERQLQEEKLRNSEAEIRAFFEAMTDIVLMIDARGNSIKVAPTNAARLYDCETDLLNQTIEKFFLDETAELFQSQVKLALDTQQIVNFEYSLSTGDRQIWFAASISPRPQNSVIWVARDISDRKQQEAALQLIVEGTASKTGKEFFRSCVRYLASVLHVRYAIVTKLVDAEQGKFRTLAFWQGEDWSDDIEYNLAGTPCESVITEGRICYYPDKVQERFPQDRYLIDLDIASYSGIPLVDSAGKVLGHLAVLDVKPMSNDPGRQLILRIFAARAGAELERQLAEEALQESEERFRNLFTGAADAIFLADPIAGRILEANPAASRLLSKPLEEIIGMHQTQLHPPQLEEYSQTAFHKHSQQEDGLLIENVVLRSDGSLVPVEISAQIANIKGKHVLQGIFRDITERKRAEAVLQRKAATDSLLGSISRAFLDQDIDTAINFTLQAIGKFTGSDRSYVMRYSDNQSRMTKSHEWCDEGIKSFMHEFQGVPTEDYPWFREQLLGGSIIQADIANLSLEATAEQAEFQRQGIQSMLSLPIIHSGKAVGFLGLHAVRSSKAWSDEDINLLKLVGEIVAIGLARHEAEVAQQQATAAALAANRAKSEFLANMSHELRTPLTAILGLSEVLRDEVFGPLNAKQQQKLATIEQSGKHLLELINDVLDLAKIESGKMELQLVPTDIQRLCDASLAFVRQQAHQKRIKLSAQVIPQMGKVVADERRMRQVLINLLSNAVKFTPEGGAVWIEVHADSENEVLHFSVIDTGIGITKDDMAKLFQPFVQLDSSFTRRYKGTGLGLALVRQVVELHGGSVALESEVGQGSRFTVSIPWVQETVYSSVSSSVSHSQFPIPNSPFPILHQVLIVEDSPPAAEQVARYLAELGATNSAIHSLGTGTVEEALRMNPDAIILDLQLPDRSGWDVLAQLKAHPRTQNIPVLIISVVDEPAQKEELGTCGYLVKPFSRSQFQIAWRKLSFAQQNSEPTTPTVKSSPLVLLVEDNEANISTIMEYLQAQSYRVAIALSGREAVQLTQELNPDLILMDIQMPEMDGLEATRQIRAARLTRIPIIALTSLAMPGDREKCLEAGVNDYLAKPVSLKKLVEVIATYLK